MRWTPDELAPWCEVTFDPSSGPGGQNVNKVSTRATLWFDFGNCTLIAGAARHFAHARLASRLTSDGRLKIVAQSERSQTGNREAAIERLIDLLDTATTIPKQRFETRPTAGSKRRRLHAKKLRGETKRGRQSRPHGED